MKRLEVEATGIGDAAGAIEASVKDDKLGAIGMESGLESALKGLETLDDAWNGEDGAVTLNFSANAESTARLIMSSIDTSCEGATRALDNADDGNTIARSGSVTGHRSESRSWVAVPSVR